MVVIISVPAFLVVVPMLAFVFVFANLFVVEAAILFVVSLLPVIVVAVLISIVALLVVFDEGK